ncbi:hypothetical protein NIES3974_01010 [Calothrix sp. NIES-3974]|nr:hypothetical protein NIES3974_01010 [Calothrix sp. NIES-3974]
MVWQPVNNIHLESELEAGDYWFVKLILLDVLYRACRNMIVRAKKPAFWIIKIICPSFFIDHYLTEAFDATVVKLRGFGLSRCLDGDFSKFVAKGSNSIDSVKFQAFSKLSQEGAKGGKAKLQAFQWLRTGAPRRLQVPPRRPSG